MYGIMERTESEIHCSDAGSCRISVTDLKGNLSFSFMDPGIKRSLSISDRSARDGARSSIGMGETLSLPRLARTAESDALFPIQIITRMDTGWASRSFHGCPRAKGRINNAASVRLRRIIRIE